MPTYAYKCRACKVNRDVFHRMAETPEVSCPVCGGPMVKVPCLFNMSRGSSADARRAADQAKRRADMKVELRQDYGVENVSPIGKSDFESVYKDVKASGEAVREQMAASAEKNAAKTAAKQREWKKGAVKRVPKKSRAIAKRQKERAAKDRAIRL